MPLKQRLLDRYKRYRKRTYLNRPNHYRQGYAFVGAGQHSIDNLYPSLGYLGVPLKYICTRTAATAERMTLRYPGTIGTTHFEQVLEDPGVHGLFISTQPSFQAALTAQGLAAGKAVFVEKPPCHTLQELQHLQRLEKETKTLCMVGLQRRYAPAYQILRRRLKHPLTYALRYVTGTYPEGDALVELFIHPLDAAIFLFGPVVALYGRQAHADHGQTFFLITEHAGGVLGHLELSTAYSWRSATETLRINTRSGVYNLENMDRVTFESKPPHPVGLPLEKAFSSIKRTELLFEASRFAATGASNSVVVQGYLPELRVFVDLVEAGHRSSPSSPAAIQPTYMLIEQIRQLPA